MLAYTSIPFTVTIFSVLKTKKDKQIKDEANAHRQQPLFMGR